MGSDVILMPVATVAMGLVLRVDNVTVAQTKADFKAAYPAVFKELGKLKELYNIEQEQGATPYSSLHTQTCSPTTERESSRGTG